MSVEPDAVQQDYRREKRGEHKAMKSKLSGAKFNVNTLSRDFDDNHSVGSAKSQKPLPALLFFQNAVAKIAAPSVPLVRSAPGSQTLTNAMSNLLIKSFGTTTL